MPFFLVLQLILPSLWHKGNVRLKSNKYVEKKTIFNGKNKKRRKEKTIDLTATCFSNIFFVREKNWPVSFSLSLTNFETKNPVIMVGNAINKIGNSEEENKVC